MKIDGYEALAKLGVSSADLTKLKAAGVVVNVTPAAIKLVKGGEVLASAAVSSLTLQALLNDKPVSTMTKTAMTKGVLAMVAVADLAMPGVSGPVPPIVSHTPINSQWNSPASKGASDAQVSPKVMPQPNAEVDPYAPLTSEQIKSVQTVPLMKATRLYQPVPGTSSDSRYFLVAANEEIKVAARYKASALSIRIEGSGLVKHAKNIAMAGLPDVPFGAKYVSMHLSCSNMIVANKAIGAIIMGLGLKMRTKLPVLEEIYGLGN